MDGDWFEIETWTAFKRTSAEEVTRRKLSVCLRPGIQFVWFGLGLINLLTSELELVSELIDFRHFVALVSTCTVIYSIT